MKSLHEFETWIKTHRWTCSLKSSRFEVTCINLRQAERAELLIMQKFIWKLNLFQKLSQQKLVGKLYQKLNATNGKGFSFIFKTWVFIYFHPKLAAEKLSVPFNYCFAKGAKQEANGSYDSVRRKRASKLGKAVGKGKSQSCFDKIRKHSRFAKNWPKEKWQKNTASQSTGWCLIDYCKKKHFKTCCKDRTKNTSPCSLKTNPRIDFLSNNN